MKKLFLVFMFLLVPLVIADNGGMLWDGEYNDDLEGLIITNFRNVFDDGYIQKVNANVFDLEIPSELNGENVVGVKADGRRSIFFDYAVLSLSLPGSVKKIDDHAFDSLNLTSVSFSRDNEDLVIGRLAFRDNEITNIVFRHGLKEIGDYAFLDNELNTVQIPLSVKKIGRGAFAGNGNVTIFGFNNSVAQSYADEHDYLDFVDLETQPGFIDFETPCEFDFDTLSEPERRSWLKRITDWFNSKSQDDDEDVVLDEEDFNAFYTRCKLEAMTYDFYDVSEKEQREFFELFLRHERFDWNTHSEHWNDTISDYLLLNNIQPERRTSLFRELLVHDPTYFNKNEKAKEAFVYALDNFVYDVPAKLSIIGNEQATLIGQVDFVGFEASLSGFDNTTIEFTFESVNEELKSYTYERFYMEYLRWGAYNFSIDENAELKFDIRIRLPPGIRAEESIFNHTTRTITVMRDANSHFTVGDLKLNSDRSFRIKFSDNWESEGVDVEFDNSLTVKDNEGRSYVIEGSGFNILPSSDEDEGFGLLLNERSYLGSITYPDGEVSFDRWGDLSERLPDDTETYIFSNFDANDCAGVDKRCIQFKEDNKLLIYPDRYMLTVRDNNEVFDHLEVHNIDQQGRVIFNVLNGDDSWEVVSNKIVHKEFNKNFVLPSVKLVSAEGDVVAEVQRYLDEQGIPRFIIHRSEGVEVKTGRPISSEREDSVRERLGLDRISTSDDIGDLQRVIDKVLSDLED